MAISNKLKTGVLGGSGVVMIIFIFTSIPNTINNLIYPWLQHVAWIIAGFSITLLPVSLSSHKIDDKSFIDLCLLGVGCALVTEFLFIVGLIYLIFYVWLFAIAFGMSSYQINDEQN